jgi:hypothetical protein
MDVFSAKDMTQTRPNGSRKNATIQNVPGSAKIQKTAGFFRQLSKMRNQPLFGHRGPRATLRPLAERIDYVRDEACRATTARPLSIKPP